MASPSWKIFPKLEAEEVKHVPFIKSRKFFAVDASGSTAGAILGRERKFVAYVRNESANQEDTICLWGTRCDVPTANFDSIRWSSNHGGTNPAEILKTPEALNRLQRSDVWFLVTDGEVGDHTVHELASLGQQHAVLNVPVIFMIVGYRGENPERTNISVGISFFAGARHALILVKDSTDTIYIIAAKGCFASLVKSSGVQDLSSWTSLPSFDNDAEFLKHCQTLDIEVPAAESRPDIISGVTLGTQWEEANGGATSVDLDLLFQAGRLADKELLELLSEEAFNNLAVACKVTNRTQALRSFIQAHKVEQLAPQIEDVSGAAAIIASLGLPGKTDEERKLLQMQLRAAHSKNRECYQDAVGNFATSPEAQAVRTRNGIVDAAMRTLADIEATSFSADILSRRSNRARRAEVVTSSIEVANLDLLGSAYKGYCLICCGDDEIISICLKEPDAEHTDDNTTDFALNFPLAAGSSIKNINMVSSQNVCFQCALMSPSGKSIYNERIKAIIPAVHYSGYNKKYINEQLYLALTAGLSSGAAGVAQLFMSMLEEILRTKSWAGAGLDDAALRADDQKEAMQRKETFEWMLNQLVQHTRTRETFNGLGAWVDFPKALGWIARDFETNGMASFVVTYPIAGFSKILSLGQQTAAFTSDMLRLMKTAKAVYSIAAKYLADMQNTIKRGDNSQSWKQKYLEVIYREFNAIMTPKDLGADSIILDKETLINRINTCLDQDPQQGESWAGDDNAASIMRKIQLILFWLIYTQKAHCTAQTFFQTIRLREQLAGKYFEGQVLDAWRKQATSETFRHWSCMKPDLNLSYPPHYYLFRNPMHR